MQTYNNSTNNSAKSRRVLAVGRYADNDDLRSGYNNNDMIIGCSGSGKTGGDVIPNIRQEPGHNGLTVTTG